MRDRCVMKSQVEGRGNIEGTPPQTSGLEKEHSWQPVASSWSMGKKVVGEGRRQWSTVVRRTLPRLFFFDAVMASGAYRSAVPREGASTHRPQEIRHLHQPHQRSRTFPGHECANDSQKLVTILLEGVCSYLLTEDPSSTASGVQSFGFLVKSLELIKGTKNRDPNVRNPKKIVGIC